MKLHHKILFISIGIIALIGLLTSLWLNYSNIVQTFSAYAYDRKLLINLLRHQGKHNAVILVAIIAIGSAIPGMPIAPFAILSGVCFGRWPGFLMNVVGTVLGNILAIYILSKFPHKIRPSRFRPLTDKLKNMHHPRLGLSIGYAVPMLPTLLVNYASLEMHMSIKDKVTCITLGSLPVSFLYAFGGDELLSGNIREAVIAVLLVLLLLGLYKFITHDQRIRRSSNL